MKEKNRLVFVGLSVHTRWNAFRGGLSIYDPLTEVCNLTNGVKSKAELKKEDAKLSVKRKASELCFVILRARIYVTRRLAIRLLTSWLSLIA